MNMKRVYEDNYHIDYRLSDCNGFEIYRIDYKDDKPNKRKYQVWSEGCCCEFFNSLKEARAFARGINK